MRDFSRSVTPERSTSAQQNLDRCTKMMVKERERMKEVWERLRKEQTALMEARDGLSKLMTKGTTDIWRMKNKMAEQLKDYEKRIAAAAKEDDQIREARERKTKEREEAMKVERSHAGREATLSHTGCQGCERPGCRASARMATGPITTTARTMPAEAVGRSPSVLRSKDGVTLSAAVRAGAEATESQALRPFSDSRMVKLLSTGGQMCLCLQLYTENGIATWRQTNVPNYGQSGVLMMPIKKTPQQLQSDPSTMERQAAHLTRGPGSVEVVLRGVSREPEGRTKELILYTCQATGRQSVRYRYQTGGQELTARNEGITLFTQEQEQSGARGSGAGRSGAEPEAEPEKDGQPRRQDRTE